MSYRVVASLMATLLLSVTPAPVFADYSFATRSASFPKQQRDLTRLHTIVDELAYRARECGRTVRCPVMNCGQSRTMLVQLRSLSVQLEPMLESLDAAWRTHHQHHVSLLRQSLNTGRNKAELQDLVALQRFLHDFGSMMLDLVSLSDTISDIAKEGFKPGVTGNLDTLYESLKDMESLLDTVKDNISTRDDGVGPVTDYSNRIGEALGIENLNTLKSDLSDLLTIIDDYRASGITREAALDVGKIVGRHLKDWSDSNLKERLKALEEQVNAQIAEDRRIAESTDKLMNIEARRAKVRALQTVIREANLSLEQCMNTHKCDTGVSMPVESMPGFGKSWSRALAYHDSKIGQYVNPLRQQVYSYEFTVDKECPSPYRYQRDPSLTGTGPCRISLKQSLPRLDITLHFPKKSVLDRKKVEAVLSAARVFEEQMQAGLARERHCIFQRMLKAPHAVPDQFSSLGAVVPGLKPAMYMQYLDIIDRHAYLLEKAVHQMEMIRDQVYELHELVASGDIQAIMMAWGELSRTGVFDTTATTQQAKLLKQNKPDHFRNSLVRTSTATLYERYHEILLDIAVMVNWLHRGLADWAAAEDYLVQAYLPEAASQVAGWLSIRKSLDALLALPYEEQDQDEIERLGKQLDSQYRTIDPLITKYLNLLPSQYLRGPESRIAESRWKWEKRPEWLPRRSKDGIRTGPYDAVPCDGNEVCVSALNPYSSADVLFKKPVPQSPRMRLPKPMQMPAPSPMPEPPR